MGLTEDIYKTLHYQQWKSGLEIRKELEEKTKKPIPVAYIYSALYELMGEDLVEERNRALTQEQLVARGGYAQPEYHLTEKGLKKRVENRQEKGGELEQGIAIA